MNNETTNVSNMQIHGQVENGFDAVRQRFEQSMQTLLERQAQLCVYVDGQQVVDLWAAPASDNDFNADSLVNIFSSGKSLESIALADLAGQGMLDFHAPIATYWPEYAQRDKGYITVADLMRHEAGMAALEVSLDPQTLLTENIKANAVGEILQNHPAKFRRDGNPREYHAVSRGWLANEIFRRVDDQGRTLGEYLRQAVQQPLGADIFLGLTDAEMPRREAVQTIPPKEHIKQSLRPRSKGRGVHHSFLELAANLAPLSLTLPGSTLKGSAPPFSGMDTTGAFNEASVIRGETCSANVHASARGLAKLASAMANGGEQDGHRVLDETAWQALHANPVARPMGFRTRFTQAGINLYQSEGRGGRLERAANSGRDGFYGWMGLGGSLFQWHPERKIGFAFVPTSLHVLDLVNERGKMFQQAVLASVR